MEPQPGLGGRDLRAHLKPKGAGAWLEEGSSVPHTKTTSILKGKGELWLCPGS